jgi:hypothetical protein
MKVILTVMLGTSFIATSGWLAAEGGLMKAIGKIDNSPKALVLVSSLSQFSPEKHIRELHGDITQTREKNSNRKRTLDKFKQALKIQKQKRLLGLSKRASVTSAY